MDMNLQFEKELYTVKTFAVSYSLNVYEEKDKSKNCMQYPNKLYDSYRHCDDLKTRDFFESKGINPIWAADKTKNITDYNIVSSESEYYILVNFYKGITETDCKHPCTTLSASTRLVVLFLMDIHWLDNYDIKL